MAEDNTENTLAIREIAKLAKESKLSLVLILLLMESKKMTFLLQWQKMFLNN